MNPNNPNNTIGTPNVRGGRTSPEGFSSGLDGIVDSGVTSGFKTRQHTTLQMKVLVGGESGTADRAILKDLQNAAHPILNISDSALEVTISPSSTTNPRKSAIVLYKDLSASTDKSEYDNPNTVGIMEVAGDVASNPVVPNDTKIRSVIPNGSSSAYVVIAAVTVPANSTTILDGNIEIMNGTVLKGSSIIDKSVPVSKLSQDLVNNVIYTAALGNFALTTTSSVKWTSSTFNYDANRDIEIDINAYLDGSTSDVKAADMQISIGGGTWTNAGTMRSSLNGQNSVSAKKVLSAADLAGSSTLQIRIQGYTTGNAGNMNSVNMFVKYL